MELAGIAGIEHHTSAATGQAAQRSPARGTRVAVSALSPGPERNSAAMTWRSHRLPASSLNGGIRRKNSGGDPQRINESGDSFPTASAIVLAGIVLA